MSWAEEMGYDAYDSRFRHDIDNIWITKEGKELNINQMDDSHLYFAYRKSNDDRLAKEMLLRLFKKAIEK